MSGKLFVSGDEAVALAVRQAKPHVIAAYPITPQTIVVERLSDFVEDGSLESECADGATCFLQAGNLSG